MGRVEEVGQHAERWMEEDEQFNLLYTYMSAVFEWMKSISVIDPSVEFWRIVPSMVYELNEEEPWKSQLRREKVFTVSRGHSSGSVVDVVRLGAGFIDKDMIPYYRATVVHASNRPDGLSDVNIGVSIARDSLRRNLGQVQLSLDTHNNGYRFSVGWDGKVAGTVHGGPDREVLGVTINGDGRYTGQYSQILTASGLDLEMLRNLSIDKVIKLMQLARNEKGEDTGYRQMNEKINRVLRNGNGNRH
jgi:hypothetical protein